MSMKVVNKSENPIGLPGIRDLVPAGGEMPLTDTEAMNTVLNVGCRGMIDGGILEIHDENGVVDLLDYDHIPEPVDDTDVQPETETETETETEEVEVEE